MKQNSARLTLSNDLRRTSRRTKKGIWEDLSKRVGGSRKNRALVNVGEISRHSKEGSKVVVPGKVLGGGHIDHKVTVSALSFSEGARSKITDSRGVCLKLEGFANQPESARGAIVIG